MAIQSLQREMSHAEALRKLCPSGPLSGLRSWINGPLRGTSEIYIPYRLYKVMVDDRGIKSARYFAVDAATGTLDPYEFDNPPDPHSRIEIDTRNFHPVRLNEEQTTKVVTEKVRRLLYSRGFFRLANPVITAELMGPEFYIPYWAGFYGDEDNLSLIVLNAVRQTVEGNKVRRLVKTWLLERDPQRELNLAF